jgi:hypothetical protein
MGSRPALVALSLLAMGAYAMVRGPRRSPDRDLAQHPAFTSNQVLWTCQQLLTG